jgi:hypothetical protein
MNHSQPATPFVPPMRIGIVVTQVVEALGKEDAERFLQACASQEFAMVLATVESALSKNLTSIIVSEGVTPENLNLARYQFVAASSILTELTQSGRAYAEGKHPRFQRKQDAE